ncbi:MAG: LapA family protein [Planctomycetales bacterium]|nr:LapA family protein [Planctomycetales bacterium]
MLKGTMNKFKLVAIAVISLLVLIVVLQNTQAVETNLLFLTVTMPSAALLFGTLIIGFAIGVLTAGHFVSTAKRLAGTATDKQPKAAA